MKKNYTKPVLEMTAVTKSDILTGSEVFIDGSELFGTNDDE